MAVAADDQLTLPTLERKAKLTMAQISTRKKTIAARTPTQDAYIRALERKRTGLRHRPCRHGQDLFSPSPMRPSFWSAVPSTRSSFLAPLSKPASASAFCPAT